MSVPSISLDDFQASNQATLAQGGPWVGYIDPAQGETVCVSQKWVWCNDGYCLVSAVFPPESLPSYQTSFTANISVSMDHYGDATNLDFTWSYWPLYCGSALDPGLSFPMHVQIGSAEFDDSLITVDYHRFFNGSYPWDPAPVINHSGTTAIARGSDGTHGYIPIKINMDMVPVGRSEYLNLYIKGISFSITTPVVVATVSNDSPSGGTSSRGDVPTPSITILTGTAMASGLTNSSAMVYTGTSTSPTILSPISSPDSSSSLPTGGPAVNLSPSSPPQYSQGTSHSSSTAIGAAVGSILFLCLVGALIGLLVKRRRMQASGNGAFEPTAYSEKMETQRQSQSNPDSQSALASRSPSQETSRDASGRPLLSLSGISYDPPPTYGTDAVPFPAPRPSASAALIAFAQANREFINADLEARLVAAGYMPTDDPDSLTEEEWRENHGITKLELLRLRTLYARNVVRSTANASGSASPV